MVSSFTPARPLPRVDAKTSARLQTLPSATHLSALLNAAFRPSNLESRAALFVWLEALGVVWPDKRERIMTAVLAWGGGGAGVVRELYRGWVRGGPLGKNTASAAGAISLTGVYMRSFCSVFSCAKAAILIRRYQHGTTLAAASTAR